jgi:hypothetical protein
MHYQVSDYLVSAVAYGFMGIALIVGRGILLGLTEDLAAQFRSKQPRPAAKTAVPKRAVRTRS